MWEHPFIPTLLQIGPEVQALPDAMRSGPSPSAGNPLYRSLETSETQTLTAWQSGYVMQPNPDGSLKAIPKGGWGLTLTLTPIESMSAETFASGSSGKRTQIEEYYIEAYTDGCDAFSDQIGCCICRCKTGYVVNTQLNGCKAHPKLKEAKTWWKRVNRKRRWFRDETDPKPSSFEWFNVETGAVAPLSYEPAEGKMLDVTITIPKYFAPFVQSTDGIAIGDNGMGTFSFRLNGDTGDKLTIGQTTSITISNPDTGGSDSILLPTITFQQGGVPYSLDWVKWAADKKMVFGAYAHGWGYNIPPNKVESLPEGKKAFGTASLYEENTTIHLSWASEQDTNEKADCGDGYEWSESAKKCVKSGSGDDDEDDMDWEKYAQYGILALIGVGVLSMLG